jgi:hypothetical protein
MPQKVRNIRSATGEAIQTVVHRMTIRVGHGTMSFSMPDAEGNILFEPYVVKSGVSIAANLREAFKTSDFLMSAPNKARVLIDGQVMLVPIDQFDESQMQSLYEYTFPGSRQSVMTYNVLPDLNAVAVFEVNKDLRLVLEDHFADVQLISAVTPVWRHLHQRSYTGIHQKLYGYFHEQRLDIFCFQQNRFKFANSYEIRHHRDAIFFLLYVWKQLKLNVRTDELHLVGDLFRGDGKAASHAIRTKHEEIERKELLDELRKYVQKVYVLNPSADFNRAAVTKIKGMPYDLQTLFVKGR